MITKNELQELKTMQIAFTNATKRMGELILKLEAITECCRNCGSNNTGYCTHFNADIPSDSLHLKGCNDWFYDDIPF